MPTLNPLIRLIRYVNFTDVLRLMPDESAKVFLAMLAHVNDQWECWPGTETIARRTGKSPRSVSRAIAGLGAIGFAVRSQRNGREVITEFKGLGSPAEKKCHGKSGLKYFSGESYLSTQGGQKRQPRVDTSGDRTSTRELTHRTSSRARAGVAALAGEAAAAADVLRKVGMWEDAVSELAAALPAASFRPDVMSALVRRWKSKKVVGKKLSVGLLKKMVREDAGEVAAGLAGVAAAELGRAREKVERRRRETSDKGDAAAKEAAGRRRWARLSADEQSAFVKSLFARYADNSVTLGLVRRAWSRDKSIPSFAFMELASEGPGATPARRKRTKTRELR